MPIARHESNVLDALTLQQPGYATRVVPSAHRRALEHDRVSRHLRSQQPFAQRVGLHDTVPTPTSAHDHERCRALVPGLGGSVCAPSRGTPLPGVTADPASEQHDRVQRHDAKIAPPSLPSQLCGCLPCLAAAPCAEAAGRCRVAPTGLQRQSLLVRWRIIACPGLHGVRT
jgi:hypothetical protein